MTAGIGNQACFHHGDRTAVARCPSCERFFCRECVTEHQGRVICAPCLRTLSGTGSDRRSSSQRLIPFLRAGFGLVTLWFLFFLVAQGLLRMPSDVHEGTIWRTWMIGGEQWDDVESDETTPKEEG